jgi:hypothetical protein
MKKYIKIISVLVILVFALTACSQLSGGISSQDLASTVAAQVESDINQKLAMSQLTQPTTVSIAPTPVVIYVNAPTNTPNPVVPTYTPYPYYLPTATVQSCILATAVDYNYPDNTSITGGYSFTKGWTFTNVGYCTWNSGYYLQYTSGDSMGASTTAHYTLGSSVSPNSSITVSVPMVAPVSTGTYKGYWGLYTDSGAYIGQVWVTINVNGGLPATANPAFLIIGGGTTTVSTGSGQCIFTTSITATTAGTATCYWVVKDGDPQVTHNITSSCVFTGAGTPILIYYPAPTSTFPTTVYLHIGYPNYHDYPSAVSAICP